MTDPTDVSARLASLEADNARLRRLLDEKGMHDGLRHGLRDTVAMLRSVMRQSAETAGDVEDYVIHLDGRLGALMRARTVLDAFGEANLHTLVSDALQLHLVREGDRAAISGPRLLLRPKAAQVFALAVHELASNAVEHGSLGDAQARVDVTWDVTRDVIRDAANGSFGEPEVSLVWKETGGAAVATPARAGFGTTVLRQTLAYELGAQTALAYEPDGLRCTIRFPLTARNGALRGTDDARTDRDWRA